MSLPAYPEYRRSGIDWIPDVPAHWDVCHLKRIASLRSGESITAEMIEPEGLYPVYGGNGLRGYTDDFTHEGRFALVGRQGALCGNVNYAEGKFWASEHAVVATPLASTQTAWLGELLRAMDLNQYSVSAAQPGLSVEAISNLRVPVPPRDEQVSIAMFLARETAKIDALIAEQEKLLALLAEKRQATISHAVTRGLDPNAPMKDSGIPWLGEVPAHWETVRLRHLARLNPSKTEVEEDGDPDVSFLPMEAIGEDGSIRVDQERPLSQLQNGYSYFRNGDVVVAKITPCFENGKGALISDLPRGYGFGTTELIVVRSVGCLRPAFLSLVLSSSLFRKLAEGAMYGAGGQKRVPDEFVREFTVCVPPVEEQDAIWEEVAKQTALLRSLELQSISAIALLRERRSALIAAAVTGQIDVRGFVEAQAV